MVEGGRRRDVAIDIFFTSVLIIFLAAVSFLLTLSITTRKG